MIDDLAAARPQSGLSSASVVWQAPAEGGIPRYMAIFQDAPCRSSGRSGARATTTSPGPPSGERCTPTPAGRRGPRRRSRRRATASSSTTPTSSASAGRSTGSRRDGHRTTCTRRARSCATVPSSRRRQGPGLHAGLDVRPGCAARGAAVWRDDHGQVPVQHDHATPTTATTNTYLRSVTGEKKQTDATERDPDRAQERDRDADALRAAERRPSRSASARGRPSSAAGPPGSRPTAGRSRAPGRRPR